MFYNQLNKTKKCIYGKRHKVFMVAYKIFKSSFKYDFYITFLCIVIIWLFSKIVFTYQEFTQLTYQYCYSLFVRCRVLCVACLHLYDLILPELFGSSNLKILIIGLIYILCQQNKARKSSYNYFFYIIIIIQLFFKLNKMNTDFKTHKDFGLEQF